MRHFATIVLLSAFLATALPLSGQIGVLTTAAEAATDEGFIGGALTAIANWEKSEKQGLTLHRITIASEEDAIGAISQFAQQGITVVLLDRLPKTLVKATLQECKKSGVVALRFQETSTTIFTAVADLLIHRLRFHNLALLSGKGKGPNELKKLFKKKLKGWQDPAFLSSISIKAKKLATNILKEKVDGIVIDGDPHRVREALEGLKDSLTVPVFLTPRSFEPGTQLPAGAFVLLGQNPMTHKLGVEVTAPFKKTDNTLLERGWGDGYDGVTFVLRAWKKNRDDFLKSAASTRFPGLRGPVTPRIEKDTIHLDRALGVWTTLKGNKVQPLLPGPDDSGVRAKSDPQRRISKPRFGVPYGVDMSNRFELAKGTQHVFVSWGVPGQSTIDADLKLLGLSSGGKFPLADHLVKKELLGRMMAITSQKFLRRADGTARSGESFAISFATHYPPRAKKGAAWKLVIAGDDPDAGGRAYPGSGLAFTFSTFLRRTIFQSKAISPPLNAEDLPDLLGCKTQDEFWDDSRALMIQALIDGYAGSMALTTAHEVGHLAGLGHITDDARGIMNVNEGAGLGYRFGRFSEGSKTKLRRTLGIDGPKKP